MFTMASSCMYLCQRCVSLHSRTMGITLNCSTRVHHCFSFFRTSSKSPAGLSVPMDFSTLSANQRVKPGICYYSDFHAKTLTGEALKHTEANAISGTDDAIATYKTSPIKDAYHTTECEIMLDIDAAARLSALEEISEEEAVGLSVPAALSAASTSLRDYVDKSDTLSKLVQLGVNLWKVEQRPNVASMLLKLDFNTDVVPRLLFLKEIGVEDSRLGYILSHNPFILTESLENLQARVNYLKLKSFSHDTVASMVSRAPYLLNFSVKRLDNRLGFYQQQLQLSASNTRDVVARLPRLLCGSLEPVKETLKVCKIELGFKDNEIQHIVVTVPKVLTINKRKLTQIFDYLHNTMKVPHDLIVKFPQVLNSKYLRLRERHIFLKFLGKAQFDPNQAGYIALDRLVSLPDDSFCTEVAVTTLEDFHLFLKKM